MNWVLPIAGKGKRVRSLGSFKPFIKIHNKKIIEWFFLGIKHKLNKNDKIYFITTLEFEKSHQFSLNIKKILKNLHLNNSYTIKFLDNTPNGPALSVKQVLSELIKDKPCIVINCDQVIDFHLPKNIESSKIFIPIYFDSSGKSSYVRVNKKGYIANIYEKKMISCYASSGVYIFGSTKILNECYKIHNSRFASKELYMSQIINNYLEYKKEKAIPLSTIMKYDLGNIHDISSFKSLLIKRVI